MKPMRYLLGIAFFGSAIINLAFATDVLTLKTGGDAVVIGIIVQKGNEFALKLMNPVQVEGNGCQHYMVTELHLNLTKFVEWEAIQYLGKEVVMRRYVDVNCKPGGQAYVNALSLTPRVGTSIGFEINKLTLGMPLSQILNGYPNKYYKWKCYDDGPGLQNCVLSLGQKISGLPPGYSQGKSDDAYYGTRYVYGNQVDLYSAFFLDQKMVGLQVFRIVTGNDLLIALIDAYGEPLVEEVVSLYADPKGKPQYMNKYRWKRGKEEMTYLGYSIGLKEYPAFSIFYPDQLEEFERRKTTKYTIIR